MVLAELAFSAGDLAQTRFAVCPLWELGTSYRIAMRPATHPVHLPWAEQVRPRLAGTGLASGWLSELIPVSGYVPDFFNPAPAGSAPSLGTELAALLATPAARVRADLDRYRQRHGRLGPRLASLYADPAARLPRLAAELETYWSLAIAPYWDRIRALLDADIFHRARQAAEHGAAHVLGELHASISWAGETLSLTSRPAPIHRTTSGPGLVLIPSAFTGPGVFTRVNPPDAPQIAYPARGSGTLWLPRPATGTGPLAAVLGRTRTLILAELDTPSSTQDLASRTGISAPGVSQHLTALRAAGLVSAHRAGRFVLYARTRTADLLVLPES
ncbi:winged helix-turn-helix domain-containing protein [Longispora albida]|uniref:winged helix-turn-helix domain-containing protein n=1 Tax=Longispora albida TaxID=203523 RepID=UPI00035EAD4F|nr:winged helix-turn-helix domain-containing protein [Longispora albida]